MSHGRHGVHDTDYKKTLLCIRLIELVKTYNSADRTVLSAVLARFDVPATL